MAPTQIEWIVQQFTIVSSDIKHDRQSCGRMDSCTDGVKRKFSNWDAHSSYTQVSQSKNPLSISHHDDFNFFGGSVVEKGRNVVTVRIGNVQSTRPAKHMAVLPAAFSNC